MLQKPIQHPGKYGGKNPKAYYPSSIEYGFLTWSKDGGIRYVPGQHFMRNAAEEAEHQATNVMIDTLDKELNKLCQEMKYE